MVASCEEIHLINTITNIHETLVPLQLITYSEQRGLVACTGVSGLLNTSTDISLKHRMPCLKPPGNTSRKAHIRSLNLCSLFILVKHLHYPECNIITEVIPAVANVEMKAGLRPSNHKSWTLHRLATLHHFPNYAPRWIDCWKNQD